MIENNKFKIQTLTDVIESFERSIERTKKKPKTKKRTKYIAELEQLIEYRKDKIRTLEIEIELEEMKEEK